jgi:DNA helicase-2/ATP-dependent DNA helicase PcrA
MFPSPKAVEEGRDDEERRLFYVAVTRAKDRLAMMSPEMRHTPDGGEFAVRKSIFVSEIPKELVDLRRIVPAYPSSSGGYGRSGYGNGYGGYGRGGYGSGGYGRGGYGGYGRGGQSSGFKTTWRR